MSRQLSHSQRRALEFVSLRHPAWVTVSRRYSTANTLMSLVRRGLLERRTTYPGGHAEYRLVEQQEGG